MKIVIIHHESQSQIGKHTYHFLFSRMVRPIRCTRYTKLHLKFFISRIHGRREQLVGQRLGRRRTFQITFFGNGWHFHVGASGVVKPFGNMLNSGHPFLPGWFLNYIKYDTNISNNTIYLSFSDSTWKVLSITVVHWSPRIRKVKGLGRSWWVKTSCHILWKLQQWWFHQVDLQLSWSGIL